VRGQGLTSRRSLWYLLLISSDLIRSFLAVPRSSSSSATLAANAEMRSLAWTTSKFCFSRSSCSSTTRPASSSGWTEPLESRCKAAEREADAGLPQSTGWHCVQLCNGRTRPCRDPGRWWGVGTWGSGTPCQQSPLARDVASHRHDGIGMAEGFPTASQGSRAPRSARAGAQIALHSEMACIHREGHFPGGWTPGRGKEVSAPWSLGQGSWRNDGLGKHGQSRGFWGSHLPGKLLSWLLGLPLIPLTRRGLPHCALLQSCHLRDNSD